MPTETIGENTGDDYGGNSIDTRLRGVAPTANFGSTANLAMFRSSVGDIINGVLSFPDITDITGPVTVSSSSSNMYMTGDNGGETLLVEARKLLRDWIESEATYNKASTTPDLDWTSPGALSDGNDRNAAVSATSSINTTTGEYKTFTGSQLDTDNENDINGSTTHYGHVYEHNASVTSSFKSIEMSEGTDGQRPYSSITYTAAGDTLTASDGFELSDSVAMAASISMSMSDNLGLSDSSGLTASSNMTADGSLVLTETIGNTISALMNLSDTVEFSETAQNTAALLMSLVDNQIFSDQVSIQSGNFMNSADGLELSEEFSADTGVLTLTMNDGVTFATAVSQIVSAVMAMDGGIILSDTASMFTGDFVEGPIKITVQVKQSTFDIVVKESGFLTVSKQSKFDTEIN